jgi:LCP family protein required for cell wall assembly
VDGPAHDAAADRTDRTDAPTAPSAPTAPTAPAGRHTYPPVTPAATPGAAAAGHGDGRPMWRDEPPKAGSWGPTPPESPVERTAVLPPEFSPRPERPRLDPTHGFRPPPGSAPDAPGYVAPGRRSARRRPRRRLRLGRILASLPLLLVLYLVFLLVLVATSLNKIPAFPTSGERPGDSRGETWLLVGSDSREGLSTAERRRLRTGSTAGRRTDTIMVLHVPTSGKPTLVSLPRDSYVDVPGRGKQKLNAAYAVGGAPLLVRTVEGETGMRVDHYMEIGFKGIVGITDAVGGVDVCAKRAIQDPKAGLKIARGCQEIDGETSLGYVRTRQFDPLGDLGRIQRQQEWLGSVADKVTSPSVLLNPVAHVRLARSSTDAITVDEDTGLLDLISAARGMRAVAGGGGVVTTVPVDDPDYRRGGQSFVRWDEKGADALFDALRAGKQAPASKPQG